MTSFGFGSTTVAPAFGTGFSFGAPTSTTSTPSFASSAFSNTATNVSGSGFSFGGTPATSAPTLFGTSNAFATTTSSSLLPAFGQSITSSAPSTGFNFGGFGTTNLSSTGFGGTMSVAALPTATSTTSVGLGGVNLQASSLNGVESSVRKDKAVKETFIPNEIITSLDAFKKYIKEQKTIREEMSRWSCKNISKVQRQIQALKQQLSIVSNGCHRNAMSIAKLKQESSQELRNAEVIQRTKDTPLALQYENTAPAAYFDNLAVSFENQMQSYRQQIEQLERHLVSLSQPSTLTPNELTQVMRRLHDAFVTLAAQLQSVHQQVQGQKEQFLSLRKVDDGDMLNLFNSKKATSSKPSITSLAGISLIGQTLLPSNIPTTIASNIKWQQARAGNVNFGVGAGNVSGLSMNSGTGISSFSTPSFGVGISAFGTDNPNQSPFSVANQKPFQLQKPPTGSKRGKRWTST